MFGEWDGESDALSLLAHCLLFVFSVMCDFGLDFFGWGLGIGDWEIG